MKPRRWCYWATRSCHDSCPIPSVDNFGNAYPGCALVRLKSAAELGGRDAPGEKEKT